MDKEKKAGKGTLRCGFCNRTVEYVCSDLGEKDAAEMAGFAQVRVHSRYCDQDKLACNACRKLLEGNSMRKKAVEVGNSACVVVGIEQLGRDALVFTEAKKK